MKTVLLTGANGFLGSHLLESLIDNNYKVIILKRTFSDLTHIKDLIKKVKFFNIDTMIDYSSIFTNKIDVIIHCATLYDRDSKSLSKTIESNVLFPIGLLDEAEKNNVPYFINTDTFTKSDYGNLSNYNLSKRHLREWLKLASAKIKVVNIKMYHLYGDRDRENKFVPFIVNKMLDNVDEINLTKGKQKRDFIYVKDVVSAYLKIIESLNKIYNNYTDIELGTGKSTSIKNLVLKIKEICGTNSTRLNFGALDYVKNEPMNIKADIRFLKSLGWHVKYDLESGLKKTIDYYKQQDK